MTKATRNLVLFFAATFIWTWAFYIPIVISGGSLSQMPWMILLILGGMGPSLVGVAMVLFLYNQEQRRDFWRRCFSFKAIGLPWWLLIFLVFPVIYALNVGIDRALGGAAPGMEQLRSLAASPAMWPLAAFISFMSGPWSEEFGWRGVALKPMLKRFGIVPGSIVLGVIWAVWHLPLYFMADGWHAQMGFRPAGFWTFIVLNVGLSLIMTWVFLNTRGSILSAMLLHFTSNFTSQLLAPISDRVEILRAVFMLAVGLAGCIYLARKAEHPILQETEQLQPV
jgi:membrane protease YdiL (CAAX protease family)